MRSLIWLVLLAAYLPLCAQSRVRHFEDAEQQWLAHRPEGLTWDDGSPEAAQALDGMWSAVIDDANDFLVHQPSATPAELKLT